MAVTLCVLAIKALEQLMVSRIEKYTHTLFVNC